MRKYLDVIKSSRLFRDINDDEIEAMLACLFVSSRDYAKNEFILRAGERSGSICLVLGGAVHIIKEDFLGNRNIISEALPGDIFAESYACVPGAPLEVSAAASERCSHSACRNSGSVAIPASTTCVPCAISPDRYA